LNPFRDRRLWTIYELLTLIIPIIVIGMWTCQPNVQITISPITTSGNTFPTNIIQTVEKMPNGSNHFKVIAAEGIGLCDTLGLSVLKRLEPPKEKLVEPTFTRTTDGSCDRSEHKAKNLRPSLTWRAIVKILKLDALLKTRRVYHRRAPTPQFRLRENSTR